ncbi:NAD(P)-binding protein [Byssothecium circinans]|uniref:NAD(P)-binding protein n=1 Tax=Byssothecium circinans TaxID=147558 RepID=A0A6A5TMT9_9PLEO|nr:NAD(P)-binding protein [Byssothecium circinans]
MFGTINVLVNNASYLQGAFIEEAGPKDYLNNFLVNVCGTINVTGEILHYFRSKNSGTIVFMGSRSGWEGDFSAAPYNATKYALEGTLYRCFSRLIHIHLSFAPGIRSMIGQPGQFRTNILSPDRLSMHDGVEKTLLDELKKMQGQQPGDLDRAAERIIDVVRGEGMVEGKPFLERLPLRDDTIRAIRVKCKDVLEICDEWADASKSTSFEGGWGVKLGLFGKKDSCEVYDAN